MVSSTLGRVLGDSPHLGHMGGQRTHQILAGLAEIPCDPSAIFLSEGGRGREGERGGGRGRREEREEEKGGRKEGREGGDS